SVVLLDLDGCKAVNDELGHAAGDETLRGVAEILLKQSRGINVICRYGGDEFAVLLVETSKAGAWLYADRIRYVLPTYRFSHGRPVTARLGIASLPAAGAPSADDLGGDAVAASGGVAGCRAPGRARGTAGSRPRRRAARRALLRPSPGFLTASARRMSHRPHRITPVETRPGRVRQVRQVRHRTLSIG